MALLGAMAAMVDGHAVDQHMARDATLPSPAMTTASTIRNVLDGDGGFRHGFGADPGC